MRPIHAIALFSLGLLSFGCVAPEGETLHVAPAPDGYWDDTEAMRGVVAFSTIQEAIDAASSGDTVRTRPRWSAPWPSRA